MRVVYYVNVGTKTLAQVKSYIDELKKEIQTSDFFDNRDKILYIPIRDRDSEIVVLEP